MKGCILIDPLHIDHGELSTVTPEKAFTLGVEWATLRLFIDTDPYSRIDIDLHKENVDRVVSLCHDRGRDVVNVETLDTTWASISVLPMAENVLRLVV